MSQESDTLMGGSTYTIYSTDYTAPSGDNLNLSFLVQILIVHELYQPNEFQAARWILHDQLGSMVACFDNNRDQSDEYIYCAWGQAFESKSWLTARRATSAMTV